MAGFFGSLGRSPVPGLLQPDSPEMLLQRRQQAAAEMLERMRRSPSLLGSMNRMTGMPTPPQTAFSETDTIPSATTRAGQPLFDQELAARLLGPQREEPLMRDLYGGRELAREGVWPIPEGAVQSYSPQSPYSSPLDPRLQQRWPFALY